MDLTAFETLITDNPDISSWGFIISGVLIALYGVFKIITKGMSLVIWVALVILGVSGVHFGMRQNNVELPRELAQQLQDIMEPGKRLTNDALRSLCSSSASQNPENDKQHEGLQQQFEQIPLVPKYDDGF